MLILLVLPLICVSLVLTMEKVATPILFVYWLGLQNLRHHICCRAIKTKVLEVAVIAYQSLLKSLVIIIITRYYLFMHFLRLLWHVNDFVLREHLRSVGVVPARTAQSLAWKKFETFFHILVPFFLFRRLVRDTDERVATPIPFVYLFACKTCGVI